MTSRPFLPSLCLLLPLAGAGAPGLAVAAGLAAPDAPFSVLGIELGSPRADLAPLLEGARCTAPAGAAPGCELAPGQAAGDLLGARLQSVRVEWEADGEHVAAIELATQNQSAFGMEAVEDFWDLDGRCLDGDTATTIAGAGRGRGFETLQLLRAADLLPEGSGDFLCMDPGGLALYVEGEGITRTVSVTARLFRADATLRQRLEQLLPRLQAETEAARQAVGRPRTDGRDTRRRTLVR